MCLLCLLLLVFGYLYCGYDLSTTNVVVAKHAPDEIVSSAECSSDDEDLEECDTSQAGGLG